MESKLYSIAIVISFIVAFALIATVGTIPSIFENVLAQEDVITSEDSVNDTLTEGNKGPSSTTNEFSAVNDTMSHQNASQ
jgi:hypothetical protein